MPSSPVSPVCSAPAKKPGVGERPRQHRAAIVFTEVAFDSPLTRLDGAPLRYRRIVTVIQWCRSNPNTVGSSSLLIGSGAAAIYAARIWRSWRRRLVPAAVGQQDYQADLLAPQMHRRSRRNQGNGFRR